MPASKKTSATQKTTESKPKSTKKVEATPAPVPQPVKEVEEVDVAETNEGQKKKMVRKAGRTLLVSPSNGSSLSESTVSGLAGLSVSHSTKNGSYFLTFDSIENALGSFRKLRENHPELRVKFARYQIFFTVNGLTDSTDYSSVKKDISTFVEKESGGNVLYFKLYRKGNKYLGCGDLTVDTKDSMDKLLNKESALKNFTLGSLTGTFYRFNKTQSNNQDNQDMSEAV